MREKKYFAASLFAAIVSCISALFTLAHDVTHFGKVVAGLVFVVSAFSSAVLFRMHLDVEESLMLSEIYEARRAVDILCPLCASDNYIIKNTRLYCLNCGRSTVLKNALTLVRVSEVNVKTR